jgi:RNA polymerase sigma-70 factor (ECF subfamily)
MDEGCLPPDVLLAHGAFVRATARAVLRGDADVEDVVQETWSRALVRSPRAPGALRAWLGRIARNAAIDLRRRRARRARREAAVAKPEAARSVEEIVLREEARSRLVAALVALEEPYRSTLVLRYYDGLSVADVARRSGVERETAKTRLRRGLERLRARLRAGDERSREARGLLSWASDLGTASSIGGMAMKKSLAVGVAVLLLVGGGLVAYETIRPDAAGGARRPGAGPSESPSDVADSAPPSLAIPPPSPARRPATTLPFASGIVVDRSGEPVPEAEILSRGVEALPGMRGKKQEQPLEMHRAEPSGRTDAQGRFRILEPLDEQVSFVVRKPGFALAEFRGLSSDRAANQDLRIVLDPGRRVVLVVKDSAGRPIEGARIVFWLHPDAEGRVLFGGHTTDAGGRCELPWLPATDSPVRRLFVGAFGHEDGRTVDGPLRDEEEFVLRRTEPVFFLRDASTGAPVDGAGIVHAAGPDRRVAALVRDPMRNPLFVAPLGVLHGAPPLSGSLGRGERSFVARVFADGHVPAEARFEWTEDTEPPRVEIALVAGTAEVSLAGRVTPAGATLAVGRLSETPGDYDDDERPLLLRPTVGADGSFAVRGLPGGRYRVVATAAGFAPFGVDASVPATDLRIDLRPPARLEIRVRDSSGRPLADHPVDAIVEGQRRTWAVRTDGHGLAVVEGLPAGRVHVLPFWVMRESLWEATLRRGGAPPHPTLVLEPGDTEAVDLEFPSRLAVTLEVRDDRGRAVEGVDVALVIREGWAQRAEGEFERLREWKAKTDASGTARAELFEGTYDVRLSMGPQQRTSRIEVRPGAATVAVPWRAATAVVAGRVVEAGTRVPITNRVVMVSLDDPTTRERYGEATLDAEGRFEVGGLPSRPLVVLLALSAGPRREADPRSPYPSILWTVTPKEGERLEREFVVPRLRGEGAEEPAVEVSARVVERGTGAPLGGATVSVEAVRGDLRIRVGSLRTGPDGRASERVLAGERYVLYAGRWTDAQTHENLRTEVVPSGERVEANLELSPLAPPR